jgi:hypothetical protein
LFILVCVFLFFVCFLSSLVWFFPWLPEEVLTLLFLLHRENGDFSILMKDIWLLVCCRLPERFAEGARVLVADPMLATGDVYTQWSTKDTLCLFCTNCRGRS